MIALVVKKDTQVKTIQDGQEWKWDNIKSEVLAEDRMFFAEDIRIDPLGHVGCGPQNTNVVGGAWAKAGWYGLQDGNRCLLVPFTKVIAN